MILDPDLAPGFGHIVLTELPLIVQEARPISDQEGSPLELYDRHGRLLGMTSARTWWLLQQLYPGRAQDPAPC